MRTICGTILAAVVGLSLAAEVLKTVDHLPGMEDKSDGERRCRWESQVSRLSRTL